MNLLIQNGRLIDPASATDARLDILVVDGLITRIASGIPVGGDIVYIDPLTIKSSLDNRKKL